MTNLEQNTLAGRWAALVSGRGRLERARENGGEIVSQAANWQLRLADTRYNLSKCI